MKTHFKRTLFFSLCLTAFLFALSATPKSYAATLTPNNALSGGACINPSNTGISYDANAYSTIQADDYPYPLLLGMFRNTGSNAPAIGAWTCMGDDYIGLDVGNVGASWYNVQATVNGITTQTTPDSIDVSNRGDHMEIAFALQVDQQYTLQVQSCTRLRYLRWAICSAWSPTLHFTTAANSYCLNGYVWREAAPFDHVCVTPDQRSQAAYDNSQAASRVDPFGAYGPQSCVNGYVWRQAFGGDYVCVTPGERSQVAYDNSQAIARIIAL